VSVLRPQYTIDRAVSVSGFGYWSGEDVRVEYRPAPVDSGITFVRDDLGPDARVPARTEHRLDIQRRTSLQMGVARVDMIEHVMAALGGLQIDNCEVGVTAAEMPGCDGAALAFIDALDKAKRVPQEQPVRPLVVRETSRAGRGNSWVEARPTRRERLTIEFHLDYSAHRAIGSQSCTVEVTPDNFRHEIAPARTFVLAQEAAQLVSQGKGSRVTAQDLLVFGPDGPLENTLRFPDECVRHKILDVIGDLALANRPIFGHIVAFRSGHHLNAELVSMLLARETMEWTRRMSA
jgi:UDP-3-O-[3-hydroxymyristoyl] N-acetylglucosamine deacetylase